MRDFIKTAIVGIGILFSQAVFAQDYKLLVLPDNIVTENAAVDSFIYDASSEFFADEVISILNTTDNIKAQPVSETRRLLKQNPTAMLSAKEVTKRFKNSYNVDYGSIKKLAQKTGDRYVLIMTSAIDAENYILRRTWWDFFNIPGASVIDPAYKISTYAVLVDTDKNKKLWGDTYYKTISVVENRIITRGPSPQTEQLSKIKDYSRYLCPQIAKNVQLSILPPDVLAKESTQIDYDLGNIDNVFTKKYRHLGAENKKIFNQKKESTKEFINEKKARHQERKAKQAEKNKAKLEVKAKPVYNNDLKINTQPCEKCIERGTVWTKQDIEPQNINYKTDEQSAFYPIEIKRTRKNNLFGDYYSNRPQLRDYENLK